MRLSEFATILELSELPVTYRSYRSEDVPSLPYLIYFESTAIVNATDDHVSHQIKSVVVELIFEQKDEDLEDKIENLFSAHDLYFETQEENFIETERLYVKPYSVYLY